MAGILKAFGKTRLGYWIWRRGQGGGLTWLVKGRVGLALRALEHAVLRQWPSHRRHDARTRATLAAFEAETKARAAGQGG